MIGDTTRLASAFWGAWLVNFNSAELADAVKVGEELLRYATEGRDATAAVFGNTYVAISRLFQGALAEAANHAKQAFRCSPRNEAMVDWAINPTLQSLSSLILLFEGYFGQALSEQHRALTIAGELNLMHTRGVVLHESCTFNQVLGNLRKVDQQSSELLALATEHGFPHWVADATIFRGWCMAANGDQEAGVAEMRRGLKAKEATGAQLRTPYYLTLLPAHEPRLRPWSRCHCFSMD